MMRRKRMPRALAVTRTKDTIEDTPAHDIVSFPAKEDTERRTLDLGQLALNEDIKDVFRYAIEHHPTPIARDTQRGYWCYITKFARFAEEEDVRNAKDLDTECVAKFRRWLDRQVSARTGERWSNGYRGKCLMALKELIRTVKAGKAELLPSEIIFPTHCYPEGTPVRTTRRKHLTRGELKSLMWACQQEIPENKRRFDKGRKILAGEETETFQGMRDALLTAERLIQTGAATNQRLRAEGVRSVIIRKLGNSEGLRSHLGPTPRTLTPLLISIMTQLAGNVEPIRKLAVNCMHIDEMDERWARIEWEKPRSGPAPGGTQRRFGDRTKRHGAPALIATVRAMTEPLRELAHTGDRDKLFICQKGKGARTRYGLLTYELLRRTVPQFLEDARRRISKWNERHPGKSKEQIPAFDLGEIRGSVALEHYLASGGDIRRAQQALNHRQSKTTTAYIEGPATNDKNAQILAEVQRQIVQRATRADGEAQATPGSGEKHRGEPQAATAAFTHECRAPNHESGELCSHFQQCLDCPGLVIPKTPDLLALLLQAEETFRTAKERLHPQRWEWLYARSYATLTRRILPEFPAAMMEEARRLMKTLPPLPDLE